MRTVKQLYDELGQLIKESYGNTRVIANCEFNITKGNGYYNDFPLCHLKDVYYQSGDIELDFSQEEEFTEENKYKDDDNGWHDLVANPNNLPKENKICLLYLGSSFNPITGWIKDGVWYFEDDRKTCVWQNKVIAWKEIIPPKE